ncbi:thioesterase-like superfamily-domain-containing protein [Crassisporium funariophilum]|nr:thioesterase-like superfamily-domain-containing protein [Crassisporium funariophilum]
MAPLRKAINVHSVPLDETAQGTSGTQCYGGVVDPDWSVGSVANGGYVLALILEACIQFQSSTTHLDPIHVTAHYLRPTFIAPFTVCVRPIKTGSGFTNLSAELLQQGKVKIMAHVIFGTNAPHVRDKVNLNLNPPSPYARRHPLYTHPSEAIVLPLRHTWKFHPHVKWTEERDIIAKNKSDSPNRTNSSTVGGGGLEWGTWFEFVDEEEKITSPSLAFLVDIFLNTPTLLPKSERVGLTTSWFPTMTMSIEFKNKIPPPSTVHAGRTVGLYSSGRFMTAPQGRHDVYVEVWTAPSRIGEGEPSENWRDNQVCLAIATQMALTLPMEVNEKKARESNSKL